MNAPLPVPPGDLGQAARQVFVVGDPRTSTTAARRVHSGILAGTAYATALRKRLALMFDGLDLDQSAITYAEDLIERMNPRDPAEEMLVVQMLLAHVRVLHLSSLANEEQTKLGQMRTVHEYADRASNTYRRLMLALAEYRRPPRAGDSFTAIQQANIAGQQVVMNGGAGQAGNATNEQEGGLDAQRSTPPALQAESRGAGIPARSRPPDPAVEALDRTTHARRQGAQPLERPPAR